MNQIHISDWIKPLLDTIDSDINTESVCKLLLERKLSIETVVIDLSSLITNTDATERSKGIYILSQILLNLPQHFLSLNEVEHLTIFFCDRLKDHYVVIPHVFSGLLAISKCSNESPEMCKLIFNGIVKETSVQQQKVSDRFLVYKLISQLIEKQSEGLKQLKADFIYGIIQIIEGERDPRCLLLVFNLVRHIVEHFELGPFSEELFEVISCYFPIVFTPPPNDEYGITKEDLQISLEQCFKASSTFAQFCIPLILEKLESNLSNAKIDSYRVLSECVPIYGFEKIKSFIPSLWTCIRIDCLKPGNIALNDIAEFALNALTAICQILSVNNSNVQSLIDDIWKDIEPAFCKPELEMISSASEIIIAAVSTNLYAFQSMTSKCIPLLLQQFTFNQISVHRKQILESLTKIISHSKHLKSFQNENIFIQNCDSIFMTITSVAVSDNESEDVKCEAIKCLNQLILSPQKLSLEQYEILSENILSLIINTLIGDDVISNAQKLLESFCVINPSLAIDKIINPLLHNLDLCISSEETIQNRFYLILSAFEYASKDFQIFKMLIPYFVKDIKETFYVDSEMQVTRSVIMAECFRTCILKHVHDDEKKDFIFDKCLDPLIQHCIHHSLCTDDGNQKFRGKETFINVKLLDIFYEIIAKGLRHLNQYQNQTLFDNMSSFFCNGVIEKVLRDIPPLCHCTFTPGPQLLFSINENHTLFLIRLAHSIFCNLRPDLDLFKIQLIIDKMLHHAIDIDYENIEINQYAAQTVGALINKIANDDNQSINVKLIELKNTINENIINNLQSYERKKRFLYLCIWITKALVMAKHRNRNEFISILLKCLEYDNTIINTEAASAFAIIHRNDDLLLSSESHSNIKFLFHQNFYLETFDRLLNGYTLNKSNNPNVSKIYATALLSQLNFLPKSVFKTELTKLLPILLDALNDNELTDNQMTALSSITQILIDGHAQVLETCLQSLVFRCISLSLNSPYLKVRSASLKCLSLISNSYDQSTLSTLRSHVIKNVKLVLNDKKRIVRKHAVETHCKWILIGQP